MGGLTDAIVTDEKMDEQMPWFRLPKPEWAPSYWTFINIVVSHYKPHEMTEEAKEAFKQTMLNLRYLLPCPKCRAHFEDHIVMYPIEHYMEKKDGLIEWIRPVLEKTRPNDPTSAPTQTTMSQDVYIPIESSVSTMNQNMNQVASTTSSRITFFRNSPDYIKTSKAETNPNRKMVKVPGLTEEIVMGVVEGTNGKKFTLKRKRTRQMSEREYIQHRIDTLPHVSSCNCG